jgi:hypothetical protein
MPLDEAQAYARSYGDRGTEVRPVKLPPRRPRYASILLSGEQLRRGFEKRLEEREEEDDT